MTRNITYHCATRSNFSESDNVDCHVFIEVQRKLRDSGYPSLGKLTCRVVEGQIILKGQVPSFYLKQVAQTLAASIDEHQIVKNLIEVKP